MCFWLYVRGRMSLTLRWFSSIVGRMVFFRRCFFDTLGFFLSFTGCLDILSLWDVEGCPWFVSFDIFQDIAKTIVDLGSADARDQSRGAVYKSLDMGVGLQKPFGLGNSHEGSPLFFGCVVNKAISWNCLSPLRNILENIHEFLLGKLDVLLQSLQNVHNKLVSRLH